MQYFNTTSLGEMQFGEMQISLLLVLLKIHNIYIIIYIIISITKDT